MTNNRNRFKCGREIKKRTTIWGLRVRLPPPCPVITLPATGVINDFVLRRCWIASKRLQYLPLPTELVAATLLFKIYVLIISFVKYVRCTMIKEVSFRSRPISLPENTKQLTALKQSTAENLEIPVNPSDVVMRGTIYQNSEAEQSSCPSPLNQSTQSLRER